MNLQKAKTEANYLANLRGVNHVIVKCGYNYLVYLEKQKPSGVIEIVKPYVKNEVEEIPVEVKKTAKKHS